MNRIACTVALLSACAGSGKIAELEQRVARAEEFAKQQGIRNLEIQQQRDGLAARNHALETGDRPIADYAERTLVGFVENRPPMCSGPLCLRIVNHRDQPLTDITINGSKVPLRRGAAAEAFLWPREATYIPLVGKGRYTVAARTVNAVGDLNGHPIPVPAVTIEKCSWHGYIPTAGDIAVGIAGVGFEDALCDP